MDGTCRISLVRHGRVHNPDQVLYGRLPRFRLSRQGRADAREAAAFLADAGLAACYTSPMLRARQTAREILRFHPELKLSVSALITEVLTPFQGRPEADLALFSHDVYCHGDASHEQPVDILSRADRFIRRTRKRFRGDHVAAVSHGDVILFLLLRALGYDPSPQNKLNLAALRRVPEYPATGSVTTLSFFTDNPREIPAVTYVNPNAA